MEQLKDRLRLYRKSNNNTQQDIAKILSLSQTGYFHIEKGDALPNINMLIKLSDYYNVSLDALIGRDFSNQENLPPMNTDQTVAVKMLIRLNQINFVKAYSYVAGLLVNQK